MRFVEVLLVATLIAGCGSEPPTIDASGAILLDQSLVEFPRTFVGYPTTADLLVRNSGFTAIPITVTTEAPFSMERAKENVRGGALLRLPIRFDPKRPGSHTGTVIITVDGVEREVGLVAMAELAPPCTPSALCREVEFDPATGDCTETITPSGAACLSGNLCLVDESCQAGECVGVAKDCRDDSVCTEDACDPARGCVNIDTVTATCPQPSNPCEVAACNPAFGCVDNAVADGTSCGPGDCRSAFICVSSSCGEYDVPDGTPCLDACGRGKCESGECERPDGDRLTRLWSYAPSPGASLQFAGIADAAGQLYWIEAVGAERELVSATAGGVIRYRAPTGFRAIGDRGLALEGELILVAAASVPAIEAHLVRDGSSPWHRDLGADIEAALEVAGAAVCPCTIQGGSITRGERGRALFAGGVATSTETDPARAFLAMVRTGSGETAWAKVLDGTLVVPPVADEEGNLYLLLQQRGLDPEDAATLVSLDAAGAERWQVPAVGGAPALAAWDEKVHQARDVLLAGASGSVLRRFGYAGANATGPLHGEAGSWAFTMDAGGDLLARPFDPAGAAQPVIQLIEAAALTDAQRFTDPILTRRDTALISTSRTLSTGAWEPLLHELELDGTVRRTCRLGADARVYGATSLRGGKWVVQAEIEGVRQLRAYDLPLADPAVRGWVGPHGNPAGGGRPQ